MRFVLGNKKIEKKSVWNMISNISEFISTTKPMADESPMNIDLPHKSECRKAPEPKKSMKIEPHPVIMDELVEFLKSKEHQCMMIVGLTDHEFRWCKKDICTTTLAQVNMNQRQSKEQIFKAKLLAEGHKCVYEMESFPVQIGWCGQTPCKLSSPDYWTGPYGIRVPNKIKYVTSVDGRNRQYRDGTKTEMMVCDRLISESMYKSMYAELGFDGFYYYRGLHDKDSKMTDFEVVRPAPDYWIGPHGVRVPNHITSVTAADGGNTRYKCGGETEMYCGGDMSKEAYVSEYAELRSDGFYYYGKATRSSKKEEPDYRCKALRPSAGFVAEPVILAHVVEPAYWIGPYGVRIPNDISSVVASDGYNSHSKDGGVTEMFMEGGEEMNQEIYRSVYAELKSDGLFYYKKADKRTFVGSNTIKFAPQAYWIGPYGVRVSNDIQSVVASDGFNTRMKSGDSTEKACRNPPQMNEEIYRSKYAELGTDGFYYYKEEKKSGGFFGSWL